MMAHRRTLRASLVATAACVAFLLGSGGAAAQPPPPMAIPMSPPWMDIPDGRDLPFLDFQPDFPMEGAQGGWFTPCTTVDQLPMESPFPSMMPRLRHRPPFSIKVSMMHEGVPEMDLEFLMGDDRREVPGFHMPMQMRFFKPVAAPQGTGCGAERFGYEAGGNRAPWPAAQVTVLDPCTFTVRLDGLASSDVDGLVTSWTWDFGDGSLGDAALMEHTYPHPGSFRAQLLVQDDAGAISHAAGYVRIPPCPEEAPKMFEEGPAPPMVAPPRMPRMPPMMPPVPKPDNGVAPPGY